MRRCDLAVSAGGTTLAELYACGIPVICFSIADNQLKGTMAYASEGLMLYAGNVVNERKTVIRNVIQDMKILVSNYGTRRAMAEKANKVIDGKGAERIAEQIILLK